MDDKANSHLPASARPLADSAGRTAEIHYSPAHLARIKEMARQGRRVKLPPGVTLDDDAATETPAAEGSTAADVAGKFTPASDTRAGTAGSGGSGE